MSVISMLGLIIAAIWLNLASCSLEDKGLRRIRAHDFSQKGVAHAVPMRRAERYCRECHGARLVGGENGEPSCYTCHGRLWYEADPDASYAPADHTLVHGVFRHFPSTDQVQATCTSCHGTSLQGEGEDGTPSCYLCHEQKWAD